MTYHDTPPSFWRFRVVRRMNDDGPKYGMHEAYYTGDFDLQAWTENPYFSADQQNDLYVFIDRIKEKATGGELPEWAIGWTLEDLMTVLANMRQAVGERALDEEKQLRKWGE